MSWKRAVGTVAAQTGACGALLSLPDDVRDDVGVAPGVAAIYGAGAATCYALRPAVAEGVAARGGEGVTRARRLLSREHALSKLERIWGPGDGRDVGELKHAVDDLVGEYLPSHDLTEATK